MQIVFVLEVGVDAWLEARGRVETPRPSSCPSCGSRVTFAGWYPRHTRRGRVDLHRVWCSNGSCGQRSHSLLPDVLVSGRVDLASVIGWALEAKAAGVGHRCIAGQLRVPTSTVRSWLRRVVRRGDGVTCRLWARAAAADPAVRDPPRGDPIGQLVAAAQLAAWAWSGLAGEPVEVWRYAVAVMGGRLLG